MKHDYQLTKPMSRRLLAIYEEPFIKHKERDKMVIKKVGKQFAIFTTGEYIKSDNDYEKG